MLAGIAAGCAMSSVMGMAGCLPGSSQLRAHSRTCSASALPQRRSFHASVARRSRSGRLVCAASTPETVSEEEAEEPQAAGPETTNTSVAAAMGDSGPANAVPQQRIRIKLKSYNVPAIQKSVETIIEAANSTGAKVSGPVYLPTR